MTQSSRSEIIVLFAKMLHNFDFGTVSLSLSSILGFSFSLIVTLSLSGCVSESQTTRQPVEIEYEGPVYSRDCKVVIDSIVDNWGPDLRGQILSLPAEQLESITLGPIGPLDSSRTAKRAYRDLRESCTRLKGEDRLLTPDEVNEFIKHEVLTAIRD